RFRPAQPACVRTPPVAVATVALPILIGVITVDTALSINDSAPTYAPVTYARNAATPVRLSPATRVPVVEHRKDCTPSGPIATDRIRTVSAPPSVTSALTGKSRSLEFGKPRVTNSGGGGAGLADTRAS